MKKTFVRSSDYELYRFLLPWKCLFAREENSFIVRELEKQHPRFSGTCCYDAKYSLEKKKVMAEVVVMEKASLAEYKNSGGELYLETNKKRIVFSERAKIMRSLTLLLILLAGVLSVRIGMGPAFSAGNVAGAEIGAVFEEEPASEESPVIPDSETLLEDVFRSVSAAGGKVTSFSFSKNVSAKKTFFSDEGTCSFSLRGCTPEDISGGKACTISFKDNVPYFDLELPFLDSVPVSQSSPDISEISESSSVIEKSEIPLVRERLCALGAIIETETNDEKTADFTFSVPKKALYSALKICGESAENLSWAETKLSVSGSGTLSRVSVSFSKNEPGAKGRPMLTAGKYAYLFQEESLKVEPKKKALFAPLAVKATSNPLRGEKIGEIRKNDGTLLVCYRKSDGRIFYEKKEAAN